MGTDSYLCTFKLNGLWLLITFVCLQGQLVYHCLN